MNQKPVKGLLKHADFIILDLIVLQMCFVLAHCIIIGVENPYDYQAFRILAVALFMSQIRRIVQRHQIHVIRVSCGAGLFNFAADQRIWAIASE